MAQETPSKLEQVLAEIAAHEAYEAEQLQRRRSERLRQKHARKANRPKRRPKKKR